MSAVLSVPMSDDLLVRLQEYAAAAGKTPEAVLADYVAALPKPKTGNFRRFAGKFHSDLTDASVRVDEYITDTMLPPAGGTGRE